MEDSDTYYSNNDTFLIIKKDDDEYSVKDFSHSLPIAKKLCEKDKNLIYKSCFETFYFSIYNLFYILSKKIQYIEAIAEISKDTEKITNNYCIFIVDETGIKYINSANKNMITLNLRAFKMKYIYYTHINLTYDEEIDKLIESQNIFAEKMKKLYIVYAENFFDLMVKLSKY